MQAFRAEPHDRCQTSDRSFINGNDGNFQVDPRGAGRGSRFRSRCAESLLLEHSVSNGAHRREPFPSQFPSLTVGLLSRAPKPPSAADERGAALAGLLVMLLCLENHASSCQARNPRRLAPQGVPVVLEVEVATGQAAYPAGPTATHCADGCPLQPWSSALPLGTRNSGPEISASAQGRSPPFRQRGAGHVNLCFGTASP
jgi:hypothetical protein